MKYTAAQIAFLGNGFQVMTVAELTAAFNAEYGLTQGRSAIHSTLKREKITRGRRILPGRRLTFSAEQQKFIQENYLLMSLKDLAVSFVARFGDVKTAGQIRSFIHNHAIISGRTGRFEKGMLSWNKGVKGYMGANATSFKKGSVPPNRKPLGTERIDSKDGYILVKIAQQDPYTGFPTRYRLKHVHIWERLHGPIPKGMAVVFRDGDKRNCVVENLMLVTRAELLRLNQHRYKEMPTELKPSLLLLTKLEVKTFESSRNVSPGNSGPLRGEG